MENVTWPGTGGAGGGLPDGTFGTPQAVTLQEIQLQEIQLANR
ncbi:hypothetical protein ACWDBD_23775 [Streptomyces sp. NPDC001118]